MPLRKGNSKLGASVLAFSLPLTTCTPSAWCRKYCYGRHGRLVFPVVKAAAERNYSESLSDSFVSDTSVHIWKSKTKLVRVHVTGDFYSESYVQKWADIASNCPSTRFLAYTRRGKDLGPAILKLASLDNFQVFESLDESMPERSLLSLPKSAIEGCQWHLPTDKLCSMGCFSCGWTCWNKDSTDVTFKKH